MGGKRPMRFEPRIIEGTTWAVYDLLFQKWYEPYQGQTITSIDLEEIEKRCQNLQRAFEFANPLPFLDENDSGPDFMDPDYVLKNQKVGKKIKDKKRRPPFKVVFSFFPYEDRFLADTKPALR